MNEQHEQASNGNHGAVEVTVEELIEGVVNLHFRDYEAGMRANMRQQGLVSVGPKADALLQGQLDTAKMFFRDGVKIGVKIGQEVEKDANGNKELRAELQRAHDLLVGLILKEAPMPEWLTRDELVLQAAVLCWALKHDHNDTFERRMVAIETWLQEQGVVLESHEN